jgi:Dolichyl-phosphate-mannose-protein mannosyltransferase
VAGAARLAAALAGAAAIVAFGVIAVSRLTYPFSIEWLESNSLVEVHRTLAGQSLYAAPSAQYAADGYPPLYFYVSAAAASVLGVSYLPLRLVSLLSALACFALLGRLVQRETGSVTAGISAAGLFAATYSATATWFDVGRVDSFFLALSLGGLYAARWMTGTRGAIAAGLLLAAAALTKQTGLAEGAAVIAAALLGPRRKPACILALTEVTVVGITTLVLAVTSGGWYLYYVFQEMSEHSLNNSAFGGFWTLLLPALGFAVCAAVIGARRVPLTLLAGCAALVVEGYAAMLHSGGGAMDLLPSYLAVALLAGLAMGNTTAAWWRAIPAGVLIFAQTALLLGGFHPAQAIPTSADRAAGERLTAGMRAFGGTIALPSDPGLAVLVGMAPTAQADAVYDVMRASDQAAIARFERSAGTEVATRRFSAIITTSMYPPRGYPSWLNRYYRRCPQPLLSDVPPAAFRPVVDAKTQKPVSLWLPRGRGSCQAAVRILDGAGS